MWYELTKRRGAGANVRAARVAGDRNNWQLQGLEIETTELPQHAGIPVVRVAGEIDLHSCPELRAALQSLMDAGRFFVVLDLDGVPYLDSAALGVLVDAVRRAREYGGALYLARPTSFVRRAFDITRLVKIFHLHDTVEEATAEAARDKAARASAPDAL